MRYTTLIDITEVMQVYRNKNARLVYLHLALKCGYHDDDRDKVTVSIRNLAAAVGLTVAATRHAVTQLEAAGLVKADGKTSTWFVKKWLQPEVPTPRPKQTKETRQAAEQKAKDAAYMERLREQEEDAIKSYREKLYRVVGTMTREELTDWLTELEDGYRCQRHGVYLTPSENNVSWLRSVIANK